MIKVHNGIATREAVPAALAMLDAHSLANLQTVLNPVPDEFAGIEWWPEQIEYPEYDPATYKLGAEVLTVDAKARMVRVTFQLLPADPVVLPEPSPTEWFIDVGPFYDRFGAAKLAVLASQNTLVQAILRDVGVRKWIDLKRPDVAQALGIIANSGIQGVDAALVDAVLTTPVTAEENLALRRMFF